MVSFQYFFAFFIYIIYSIGNSVQVQDGSKTTNRPHIIVIMIDDVGWNDVGFHGSNEIPTPNIDALAYSGVILNRHYTLPTCAPSRAAFMTGRHPIRMGLQGIPMNVAEPRGVPLKEKLLPEYLKSLGYVTRLVGKWHLGYYTDEHTPARRGFDSFVGYYGGYIKYFDHTVTKDKHSGIDFHLDVPDKISSYNKNQYMTEFITERADEIIRDHDKSRPLYLHLAHLAAHASEGVEPMEVSDMAKVNESLGHISDERRRRYAGMITSIDESVGKVVRALGQADMLQDSVIVFMSDNGAPTSDVPFQNYGSNYPFRGVKATVYEGSVRTPTFIFSPLIKNNSRVSEDFVHITDWLPTLYKLAGGNLNDIKNSDGIDQWPSISDGEKSKRDSILVNIDEVFQTAAAIVGDYKLLQNGIYYPKFYGKDSSENSTQSYSASLIAEALAAKEVQRLPNYNFPDEQRILELRKEATVNCNLIQNYSNCADKCLFNIIDDPCETTDLSFKNPEEVANIESFIKNFQSVLMDQTNTYIDQAGYPENFDGYWMPWLDQEFTPEKNRNKSVIWSPAVFCEGFLVNDPRNCL